MSVVWRSSSFCANGACLEMAWTASSYCSSGTCLEMAWSASSHCHDGSCLEACCQEGVVLVRDSKLNGGEDSPVLSFDRDAWRAFLAGVKADDFRQ